MAPSERRELIFLVLFVVAAIVVQGVAYSVESPAWPSLTMWLTGAAALGLLSGFITGASQKEGTAAELLGFVSGGIVVPLLGGIVAVLQQPKITEETSTYTGDHVAHKITEEATRPQLIELHPLWVAGSFFVIYTIFAVIGIQIGVRRRNETINNAPAGIKLQR